jgi:predicted Zn-dependent peptidase
MPCSLSETELEKEKGVIVDEIRMYNDEPKSKVDFLFDATLFPNMPEGRMIAGTEETVKNMTREKMVAYRSRFYTAPNTVVVVAGGVESSVVFSEIEKQFATAVVGEAVGIVPPKENKGERVAAISDSTEQAHIIVGARSFGSDDVDRYAGSLLSVILGGNMSSRLFQKIREEMGVGYYVYTAQQLAERYGSFSAAAGVDVKKVNDVLSAILSEFKKIREVPIDLLHHDRSSPKEGRVPPALERKIHQDGHGLPRLGRILAGLGTSERRASLPLGRRCLRAHGWQGYVRQL